jgi:hypothetical protein
MWRYALDAVDADKSADVAYVQHFAETQEYPTR